MGVCQDPNGFLGRIGNLVYYMCKGRRMVRSFDAEYMKKKVKKSPKYELFRVYGKLFGIAAKIASAVYRKAPKELQEELVYKGLQSEAVGLFKHTGMNESEVRKFMEEKYKNYWENKKLVGQLRKAGSKKTKENKRSVDEKRAFNKNSLVGEKSVTVKKKPATVNESKKGMAGKKGIGKKSLPAKKKGIAARKKKVENYSRK